MCYQLVEQEMEQRGTILCFAHHVLPLLPSWQPIFPASSQRHHVHPAALSACVIVEFEQSSVNTTGKTEQNLVYLFQQGRFPTHPHRVLAVPEVRSIVPEEEQRWVNINHYGQPGAWTNFEMSSCGTSARYLMDGEDTCAAMWNPEGDMGDVEA
jgi:hypothetical protein